MTSQMSSPHKLRYILDPKEFYGEDFPGETFRVLKEKEIKQFGQVPSQDLLKYASRVHDERERTTSPVSLNKIGKN